MKIIVNENVTRTVIDQLRQHGHDVISVKETMRGQADSDILARAEAEQRLVVTQDKDFGELTFRLQLPGTCGVVLFRLSGADPNTDNQRILTVLESRSDWVGHFSVVTDDRVRMRPLPSAPVDDDK
jgi:predicted nuclease of predicted toxin-antitoxin system